MTVSQLREVTIRLWDSLQFGTGARDGLRIDLEAYKAARAATAEIVNPPNSRRSPTGRAMDLIAPTVWHAICALIVFYVQSRIKNCDFNDPEILDQLFGTQVIYRGQARSWNIVPTAWRFPDEEGPNNKRLEALARYWKEWTSPDNDRTFDLFGRLDNPVSVAAVAQHYELPTTLVDFTFDPRIAVWFACSKCDPGSPPGIPEDRRDHAVIYFTSFYKLASIGNQQICLPHPAAQRIYRQFGCFADFGPRPNTIPDILDFDERWMCAQENCFRLFFPRTYPLDNSLEQVKNEWIYAPDLFFEESVTVAKNLDTAILQDSESAFIALGLRVKAKPSWRSRSDLYSNFIYTDEEFWQLVQPVEKYLRAAALVHTRDGPKLDPGILAALRTTSFDAVNGLQQVAKLPYEHSRGVVWIAERIKESEELLEKYLRKDSESSRAGSS